MKLLGRYKNGNCDVSIYDDGTKVRETEAVSFEADFPECMDVKITNYCDMGCPYCHEDSTKEGLHGDILSPAFLNTLHPFTEIAIGGGNPLSHPDLEKFLIELKNRDIIANMTVNQTHFIKDLERVVRLSKLGLIKGVGVSLTNPTEELIDALHRVPNVVLHIINGVVDVDKLKLLYGYDFKVLILGYKQFRKGVDYHSPAVEVAKDKLSREIIKVFYGFKIVSFDNLALRQLNIKKYMSAERWEEFYMGDDGKFTMYMDLVEQKFAQCSVAIQRFDLMSNIVDMFAKVKKVAVQH